MNEATLPTLEARVRPHRDASCRPTQLLAFAELTIGGAFVIKGIRVMRYRNEPDEDPFLVFPAERGRGESSDRWYDLAHPCTVEARQAATKLILETYKTATEARP